MLLISGTFLYCSYLKTALISFTKPVLCARSRTVALQTVTERDMAPPLMAKKSVLMCFKRLDNEDSIVKQGKKHIYSLFPHGTKRFKKMVLGLVFPVEEEEKINPNHKPIAYFWQATTELCLELLSSSQFPLYGPKEKCGGGGGNAFRFLKKKKKKQDEQTKPTDLEIL